MLTLMSSQITPMDLRCLVGVKRSQIVINEFLEVPNLEQVELHVGLEVGVQGDTTGEAHGVVDEGN